MSVTSPGSTTPVYFASVDKTREEIFSDLAAEQGVAHAKQTLAQLEAFARAEAMPLDEAYATLARVREGTFGTSAGVSLFTAPAVNRAHLLRAMAKPNDVRTSGLAAIYRTIHEKEKGLPEAAILERLAARTVISSAERREIAQTVGMAQADFDALFHRLAYSPCTNPEEFVMSRATLLAAVRIWQNAPGLSFSEVAESAFENPYADNLEKLMRVGDVAKAYGVPALTVWNEFREHCDLGSVLAAKPLFNTVEAYRVDSYRFENIMVEELSKRGLPVLGQDLSHRARDHMIRYAIATHQPLQEVCIKFQRELSAVDPEAGVIGACLLGAALSKFPIPE